MQDTSSLFIDANVCKTYNPARNDSLPNIHNPIMLSIWRANVDFQHVLCKHFVLKYISKYASKYSADYEELVNFVQRHTKCLESTFLRKKGTSVQCRYGFPYELQAASSLFIDANGCKTYNPARNDSLLNIHNPIMLSIWRDNVDYQPVLCKHAVLKYISKYASKAEPK